jgi:hypothetical protein
MLILLLMLLLLLLLLLFLHCCSPFCVCAKQNATKKSSPMLLEHLHQRSECGSALEILDEVQQSKPSEIPTSLGSCG